MSWNLLSFLQLFRLPLGAQTTCLLLCILLLFLYSSYMEKKSNKCVLMVFLCLHQHTERESDHAFSLYCLGPLARAPTCVVSASRFPLFQWGNGIRGTTFPGHKLGTKGHRGEEWAAGEQHRGRGQPESIVCHLEININLFHWKANWRRSIMDPREKVETKFSL